MKIISDATMAPRGRNAADWLERFGLGASLLCLVHCLALPFLFAALPALSSVMPIPEAFHIWVLAFAVPTSGLALITGRARHGVIHPLAIGIVGLGLLAVGALAFGETIWETPITVVGGLSLAAAHVINWRLRHAAHVHA